MTPKENWIPDPWFSYMACENSGMFLDMAVVILGRGG